ncbi:MAG TPA: transglutaminaseTgpA domain-containing protein [Candidatus Limnocylindrales bacterium]|nr:transglutaminaseTgpA domain-containing protein [Candidatus Limnocylindrales bacterium]
MTVLPHAAAPVAAEDERAFAPSEGWSSLLLLLAMLGVVALAVDEPRWVGLDVRGESQTRLLLPAILMGGLWGFVSGKSRLPTLLAHLAGALLAAPFLILATASVVSDAADPMLRVRALLASFDRFYIDLFWEGVRSAQTTPFVMTVGVLAWATGQFAGFNVFRRRRPLGAIFIAGAVLVANISLTIRPQYPYLVAFAAAALLLLVRLNLLEQREGWLARRIGDAGYVSGLYMRSGLVFVAAALVGSMALTATASSAPLANAWDDLEEDLVRWGQDLNRLVGGVTAPARGPSGLFGSSQTIRGFWESTGEVVFRATTSDGAGRYWRAASYDAFDGTTWTQLERDGGSPLEPGRSVLEEVKEPLGPKEGRSDVTVTVTAADLDSRVLLSPETPITFDRPVTVFANRQDGPLVAIEANERLRPGASYQVVASVRNEGEEKGGVTKNKLAAAGVRYPSWMPRYVQIRDDSIGPIVKATTDRIVRALPEGRRAPYHVAEAIQDHLYSEGYIYDTDVQGLCGTQKVIDCFLRVKRGYCEYFASAMVMMLRTQGIPARLVMGYLPGQRLVDGSWEVRRDAAHAWVEVFFPGYGWVAFDPTPGNQENGQQPTELETGRPVASPTPAGSGAAVVPRPTFGLDGNDPDEDPRDRSSFEPAGGGAITGSAPPAAPVAVLVVAGLLLLAGSVVAWGRSRGRPRRPEPDAVYSGVARWAGFFGHAPRPTQTAYEYAGVLGELVPGVRTELQLVARAKVEANYARRPAEGDALRALRDAYRRLRIGLLRLAFRRRR